MARVIRFNGYIVRDQDAITYLVSRGSSLKEATQRAAKAPTMNQQPIAYRSLIRYLDRDEREAQDWNDRQQAKAERRTG